MLLNKPVIGHYGLETRWIILNMLKKITVMVYVTLKMPCVVKQTSKVYDSLEQNGRWKEIKSDHLIKKYKFCCLLSLFLMRCGLTDEVTFISSLLSQSANLLY
jgi:hypothetical protein